MELDEKVAKLHVLSSPSLHNEQFLLFFVTNHVLAQLVLLRSWKETTAYKNDVHLFAERDRWIVANLHLPALGAVLTVFAQEHAVHIGVKVEGPISREWVA